ncbi:otogelin [Chanos chanos]|uniref:Otogelin n=1 Tax=Chanos chanos TaxID=29144 RepID=A0A6J2WY70_CHACN|nr:otogelin [Chanos chanos]
MDPNLGLGSKRIWGFLLFCFIQIYQVHISWTVDKVNLTSHYDFENKSSSIMPPKWDPGSQGEQEALITNLSSASSSRQEALRPSVRRFSELCSAPCLNGGQCVHTDLCNCSSYQAAGARCQTVPNTGFEREMTCRSWGQYNYETFDGLYYYFPGKCTYTLLRDCEDTTQSSILIQVHNDPDCSSVPYSCSRAVSLFLPWEGEIRLQNSTVSFKGQRIQLPHNIHDIELERISQYILVSQPHGFTLAWEGRTGSVYIKMSPEYVGRTCGLCGNFNADIQDDLRTSYGVLTEDVALFGNSWADEQPQQVHCPMVPSFFTSPCSAKDPHTLLKVEEVCGTLLKEPFKSCHEFVSPYSYMASCSNDLCQSGPNGDAVCQVFAEYARACAHAEQPLHDWREQIPGCGVQCPPQLQHRECITCCPVSCNVERMCIDSKLQCLDGCYCPDDLIYEGGVCVKASDCPCEYHGMIYPPGHTVQEECNNCTCVEGAWNCTEHSCPGECSVTGDMYFKSFDGRVYTFPATCQYVLAKSRNSGKFTVTIQNAPCGPNLDGACIQSVNLVVNEDPKTEVTMSRVGEVFMSSQFRISLPYSDEVFQIQELSSLFLQVKTAQGLRLQYNWREFRLYLQVDEFWKEDTVGLCGTFNGNIQDDFLAPSGMIESTPQLFGNAWRVSSACVTRPSLPQLDPCDTHQQAASYAIEKCEVLNKELFSPCHEYLSPLPFYQQCRADTCKCGQPCLCSALAHYARLCRKHSVIVEFRAHISECAITCPSTMEYGMCVSACRHSCSSLSLPQPCGDECEEGCVCPQGMFYSTHTHTCVRRSECPCSFLGADYAPGEVIMTAAGVQVCQDGRVLSQSTVTERTCPPGQYYDDCGNMVDGSSPTKGLACELTCESYLLNLTCSAHEPCVPGCVCPAGLLKHGEECFQPESCPCLWKGKEYYPGDKVTSPCHTCVCQHGSFQCQFRPCPSMCTAYGDRHYRTFDGLVYDYVGACKVYLVKSTAEMLISVTAENVDCFETGVICRKSLLVSIGRSLIVFDDDTGKPNPSSVIDSRQSVYIWQAGYFTILHVPEEDISVLWDRKTTIHIQAGPRWQGKLSGLCGNFDLRTVNEMRTPENIDSATPQEFGNSWTAAECVNSPDVRHPCTLSPLREPFAKRQCGILLSEVFQACHPVVDVTWFYVNCLADTCGCNRGGDCECFCTSVAAYAHACCQQGVTVDWRSPSVCPYDCEYYNKVLGKGPFRLITYRERDRVLAVNRSSAIVFPRKGVTDAEGIFTLFMLTPALSRSRPHDTSLVSFEAAQRPNYFLHVDAGGHLKLSKWEDRTAFWDAATFVLHRDTWISGYDSLESFSRPGFFLHYMLSWLHLMKYNHTDGFRKATLFKLTGTSSDFQMGPRCQWRYELCASPCFRTCSDPGAQACATILKVEGCIPQCPGQMVLDEVTQRCVHLEDCIKPVVIQPITPSTTEPPLATVTSVTTVTASPSTAQPSPTTAFSPASPASTTALPTTTTPIPEFTSTLTTKAVTPTPATTVPELTRTAVRPTPVEPVTTVRTSPGLSPSPLSTTERSTGTLSTEKTTTVPSTTSHPLTSTTPRPEMTSTLSTSSTSVPPASTLALVTPTVTTKTTAGTTRRETARVTLSTPVPSPTISETSTVHTSTERVTVPETTQPTTVSTMTTVPGSPTVPPSPGSETITTTSTIRTSAGPLSTKFTTETGSTGTLPDKTDSTPSAPAPSVTSVVTTEPSATSMTSGTTPSTEHTLTPTTTQSPITEPSSTTTPALSTETEYWNTTTTTTTTTTETSVSPAAPFTTAEVEETTTIAPPPTRVCTPPYSEIIDECTKYICVSGQLVLFNKSQNCPFNSTPPNCGLLGFAILVNGDKCCPKWDCPCRCSVFPDLNVITFDGNSVAIFKAASYVVAQLPNETVSIVVQECPANEDTLLWNFTNLCLAALNITHKSHQVLINRLQRRLFVNSRYAKPRFKKYGFEVLDTGNMYLIRSPAGLKIQWFHSTGMMVIETESYINKLTTMGLCGCCDGNPANDLTLSNGTVVGEWEDPAVFIDSWQVPNTTSYVSHSRRREVNCSTSDCSQCLSMLQNSTFTPCHTYVPPATFCEVWVRDAEYVNNPCVALAAYVASCHKFNICIEWRSPDYCPFVCPEDLVYQACLPACTAQSCPNQDFEYDPEQCTGLAEGCVCPEGTLLHRPYSALCIPPSKCACTDSFGTPRASGEVWKASLDGCCMYKCDNDTIVPVEYNCSDVPQPVCTRTGEVIVSLADDRSCCPQKACVCNQSLCVSSPPECKYGEKMVSYFRPDSCCPEHACECDPEHCETTIPTCRQDQTLIAISADGSCCLAHICMCDSCPVVVPECLEGEFLTVDANSTDRCCPVYHCVCEPHLCPELSCPVGMAAISTPVPEQCCPSQSCECACDRIPRPKCNLGETLQIDRSFLTHPENTCACKRYKCVRESVCVDGERGVLKPGQMLVEHSEDGVCHTTQCTSALDQSTGFYRIRTSSTNCSAQCQPNQIYVPPKDPSSCCGQCKNVSCLYQSENGTVTLHKPGKSWVLDCMRFDCTEMLSGPTLVSYTYSCPPFNETECVKIGGTIVSYMDGCCKTCTGYSLFPFPVSPLKPTISTNCERGKEDGKSCQKVTVRMTIRKNDCRSNRPVNIVSCDGKCPSASIYNYNINTYARFCKCCREMGLQRRSVQLYCSGNSSWVSYSIQEPTDCSCQWS